MYPAGGHVTALDHSNRQEEIFWFLVSGRKFAYLSNNNSNGSKDNTARKLRTGLFKNFLVFFWNVLVWIYTECPCRNVPDFGRVFLMLTYTDITQNTYVQSGTVTEIMAREKCGLLAGPRTVPVG